MKTLTVLLFTCCIVALPACSGEDAEDADQVQEFAAEDADFANYTDWTQTIEPRRGEDPAGLIGEAHGADDTEMTRHVFINDENAMRDADGDFPIGTRLVKEVRKPDGSVAVVTAMAKRGGAFNAENGSWEWFLLDETGAIQNRGANMMNDQCNECHAQVADEDYVFTR